ncbi:MAG TPA: helix-turn-helix domain-containing protein [Intrasporangium sp.]|uniref:helix-turn-helix transcriptional regulator n=1 Tax=Intrasporangium sp. TaxID=1925024 RepID=UPI002B464123|nr:helix-turn-helix domain-containing protein [Intrasporangium sp.]HKX66216.1 helix-turn-helix domain-containing protein [Intrasporangium sp.]
MIVEKNEGWGPRPSRTGMADAVASLSAQRRRVLDALDEEPRSIAAVAQALGLHVNTAREHLDGLVDAGLALRSRLTPNGRGRPGWGYAVRPGVGASSVGEYASLATVLAEHAAAQGGDVAGDMARLGRGWGRGLVGSRAADKDGEPDPERTVVEVLDTLGFDPEERPPVVRLRQCPMLDVARRHPEVVCRVHLGLVEGVIEAAGGDPEGVDLEAFAEPDACLLHLDGRGAS